MDAVEEGEWLAELMTRPFIPPGARPIPRPSEVRMIRDEWVAQHGGPALPLSRDDTILYSQDGFDRGPIPTYVRLSIPPGDSGFDRGPIEGRYRPTFEHPPVTEGRYRPGGEGALAAAWFDRYVLGKPREGKGR
jgi:hypothetical protein